MQCTFLNLNALHGAAAKDPSLLHHELLGLPGEHLPVLPVLLQLAQHLVHPLDKELDIINGCSNAVLLTLQTGSFL